jgi:hypothetical protein
LNIYDKNTDALTLHHLFIDTLENSFMPDVSKSSDAETVLLDNGLNKSNVQVVNFFDIHNSSKNIYVSRET